MRIGVPKEIKILEYRVGMVPDGVKELVDQGHEVIVEKNAGLGIGVTDANYEYAGASIVANAKEVFQQSELIVKVKEPQPLECEMLKSDQVLFTYLHLAANRNLTAALVKSGVSAIAYETVTSENNSLPLLTPMSEVAGRISIQAGAYALQKANGGSGILLGGVTGVASARVLIIGGGVAGTNAAEMAIGLGAHVTILDLSESRLEKIKSRFGENIVTRISTKDAIDSLISKADLIVGAVLVTGAVAPKLILADQLKKIRSGSVMVDISIDQGGCFETSRPTTHSEPTYVIDDVVHYCVTNMPGAVPRTSTLALTNVTLPFIKKISNHGFQEALEDDSHLRHGLNIHKGAVTYKAVADELGYKYLSAQDALASK